MQHLPTEAPKLLCARAPWHPVICGILVPVAPVLLWHPHTQIHIQILYAMMMMMIKFNGFLKTLAKRAHPCGTLKDVFVISSYHTLEHTSWEVQSL